MNNYYIYFPRTLFFSPFCVGWRGGRGGGLATGGSDDGFLIVLLSGRGGGNGGGGELWSFLTVGTSPGG